MYCPNGPKDQDPASEFNLENNDNNQLKPSCVNILISHQINTVKDNITKTKLEQLKKDKFI